MLRDPADRARGGALRITYLIDPQGTIRQSFQVQDIDGHPEEVLAALRSLQGVGVGGAP